MPDHPDDRENTPSPGPSDVKADAAIIPLSRYRAQLSRARTRRRADDILDHPDPGQLVASLSIQELYYAIQEIGLNAAQDLMELATPSQVRGFIDLDAWERDQFVPEKAAPWLESLMDLGPEPLTRAVRRLDGEVVALWLGRQARVYDFEQEAPPDEPEGHYYPTPDRFFLLDILPSGDAGKRVERFVDWLYRADLDFARQVVMAARWELAADLEEHAYRWRSGRMADLGYVDYYEALEIYRYLDPASVQAGERSARASTAPVTRDGEEGGAALPTLLLAQVEEGSFLGRTLARVGDAAALARLSTELMHLMNRVMSADRIEPADLDGAQAAMRRAAAWLGLGLELLGHGDPGLAAEALGDVALTRVFRLGFSVTLKLRRAAEALLEQSWVSLVPGPDAPAGLLDPPLGEMVASLRQPRPMYPLALAGGGDPGAQPRGERPFGSLAEVAQVARALEEAAEISDVVRRGLGVDPHLLSAEARARMAAPPEAITFATIVATCAANLLLDRPPSLVPLASRDAATLAGQVIHEGRLRPSARLRVARGLAERLAEREYPVPAEWERWLAGWIDHLEESLLIAAHHPQASGLLTSAARDPAAS